MNGLSDLGLSPDPGRKGPPSPELHRALRRATLPHLKGFSRLIRRHLPLAPFFGHDCGYMILLLLLRGGRERGDGAILTGYQRLATQTGVSRTHVRRIVEAARDAGLVTTVARGGHDIRLTPAMWNVADRWFADQFALTDLLLREAIQWMQPASAAA
jgi:DNA-binding transcriptional ArsR family regulator